MLYPAKNSSAPSPERQNLHIPGRLAVEKIQCHRRRVGQGFVHVVLHGGNGVPELFRRDAPHPALDAQHPGQMGGLSGFVIPRLGVSDGVAAGGPGQGGDVGGIHPAGKKSRHLHIGDLVGSHAVLHRPVDGGGPVGGGELGSELRLPPPFHPQPGTVQRQAVGGQQLFHAPEKGILPRRILKT